MSDDELLNCMSDYDVIDSTNKHLGGHTFVSAHNTSNQGPVTLIYDDQGLIHLNEAQSRKLGDFLNERFPCRRKRSKMNGWQRFKLDWHAVMELWRGNAQS